MHTDACRKRFETLLAQSEKGRKRFDAATQRRLDVITQKACEMQEAIEKNDAGSASADPVPATGGTATDSGGSGSGAASGSEQNDADRKADVEAQNQRTLEAAKKMSLDDQLPRHDDRQSSRGTKRLGDEPEDGGRLLPREDDARGTKRDSEDLDDGDRHRDLSQLSDHPGPVDSIGHYAKGELEWKNIG